MSKYRSSSRKQVKERTNQPHYLWRGIGCIMMLLIPLISIAAAYETINYALEVGYRVPYQLLGTPTYPDLFYKSSGMMIILSPITAIRHFYAYAVASIFYMVLLVNNLSGIFNCVSYGRTFSLRSIGCPSIKR